MNVYQVKFRNKKSAIKRKYGISWEDYMAILERQNFFCGICGCQPSEESLFCVDHDHGNGRVRGVLCSNCNIGLGHFKDSIGNLERAIAYIGKSRE